MDLAHFGSSLRRRYIDERNVRAAEANAVAADMRTTVPNLVEREALTLRRQFDGKGGATRFGVSAQEFCDPIDQVMFILGFKHDPRFRNAVEAAAQNAPTGLMDAAQVVEVHGALHGTFVGLATVMKTIQSEFGENCAPEIKRELHHLILEELDEPRFGGRWYRREDAPRFHWIPMDQFSPVFANRAHVFCLPAPYVWLLQAVL